MGFKKGEGHQFQHCPACGYGLDTGWECTKCQTDWMHFAYPWWMRILDGWRLRRKKNRKRVEG